MKLYSMIVILLTLVAVVFGLTGCGAAATATPAAATAAPAPTEAPAATEPAATTAPAPTPTTAAAPTPAPTAAATATEVATAAAAPKVDKLVAWLAGNNPDAYNQVFTDYTNATGVKIETEFFPGDGFEQAVLARWATGERPDILQWHGIGNWLVQLNPAENLQDLSDMAFVKKTVPGVLDKSTSYKGKVYGALTGYPYIDGGWYNRQVFQKLGLQVPQSFPELLATCETIKQKAPDIVPIYTGGGSKWPLQIWAFILWNDDLKDDPAMIDDLNANKIQFTDPRFVAGIAGEKELLDKGCFEKDITVGKFEDEQKYLMEGKAAMVGNGSWIIGAMLDGYGQQKLDEAVGFFPISLRTNVTSWQTVATGTYYLPKTGNTDRETASRALLDWVTGPYFQTFVNNAKILPVLQGYQTPADVPKALQEADAALKKNSVPQFQQTLLAAYGPFEDFLSEMIVGQKTPQQVAEALDQEFQRSARQLGLPGF